MPVEEIRVMIGRPLREFFLSSMPDASDAVLEQCLDAYRVAFQPLVTSCCRLLPGAREVLGALSSWAALALVTSRRRKSCEQMADTFGIGRFFKAIVGCDEVSLPKPDPQPVLVTLNTLGVVPREAVMVGDTPDDILSGKHAGTWTVGVTTGVFDESALRHAGADMVLASLRDLPDVLRRGGQA
jgi:phosphoglycolate phosphatase-like HAD superfamily hydrolase